MLQVITPINILMLPLDSMPDGLKYYRAGSVREQQLRALPIYCCKQHHPYCNRIKSYMLLAIAMMTKLTMPLRTAHKNTDPQQRCNAEEADT